MAHSFNTLISHKITGQQLQYSGRHLMVNADDYGYDARRDQGIIECFKKGIVTRASLLVNGSSAKSTAVVLAKQNHLTLGLHLNLTEGRPVLGGESSLKGEGDLFRGKFGFREALAGGLIDMKDVRQEVNAQIETFVNTVGCRPNHLDSHQHIHVLPGVREVVAELMNSHSILQTRIPLQDSLPDWWDLNKEFFGKVFEDGRKAMQVYTKHGIRFPDKFIGISLMGKNMSVEHIMEALTETIIDQTKDGARFCEFMVHPGYICTDSNGGCGDGPDDFACSPDREYEATILQLPELKHFVQEQKIVLIP